VSWGALYTIGSGQVAIYVVYVVIWIASILRGAVRMSHRQPGLDGRHRDADGRIERKHGNTLVGTLRETYGASFAPDFRSDAKLSTVLQRTGHSSLAHFMKKGG
jgi:hypothetical protein